MAVIPRIFLMLSLLTTPAVVAAPFSCVTSLGYLAASPTPPMKSIRETYLALWNELGKEITPAEMRTLASSSDPFDLAPLKNNELFALRKRLGDLKQMLEKKEWNSPEVRETLLTDLKRRSAQFDEHVVAQQPALIRTGFLPKTYEVKDHDTSLSPDGQFFMSSPGIYQETVQLTFQNRRTKKDETVTFPSPNRNFSRAHFTADGTRVLVMNSKGPGIKVIPYDQGKLDLTAAYDVTAASFISRMNPLVIPKSVPSADVHMGLDRDTVVMNSDIGGQFFFVFDLKKRFGKALAVPHLREADSLQSWGFVPGTNRLYFLVVTPGTGGDGEVRMDLAELNGFTLGPVTTIPQDKGLTAHDRGYRKVAWTADGKFGLATNRFGEPTDGGGLELVDLAKGSSTPVERGAYAGKMIQGLVAHPTQPNLLGVVFREEFLSRKNTLAWYDVAQKKWDGQQDVLMGLNDPATITPDGFEIITRLASTTYQSQPLDR